MRSIRTATGMRVTSIAVAGATVLTLAGSAPALAKRIDGTSGAATDSSARRRATTSAGIKGTTRSVCARAHRTTGMADQVATS